MSLLLLLSAPSDRLWVPTDLGTKLKLWLKGDQLSGATGAAAGWTDQSGNSVTITASASSPTQVNAALNSMNTVAFAGASFQSYNLPTGHLTGRTASASFVLFKLNNDPPTGDNGGPLLGNWGSDALRNHDPFTDGTIYDDYCSTTRHTVGNPTPSMASWRLIGFRSAASDWRCDLDAVSLFSTTTNTVGVGSEPLIGSNGTERFDGQMAEIVDANDFLTTAEKEQVEGYLLWKWGLQAQLPAGHTYVSAAPRIGTAAPSVAVDSATHAHTASSPSLAAKSAVVVNAATHAQTASSPSLAAKSVVTVQTATHAHTASSPSLAAKSVVVVQNATHAQAATSPSVAANSVVAVDATTHAQTASSPSLAAKSAVSVNNAVHAPTSTSPTVAAKSVVAVEVATHAHSATSPSLAAKSIVAANDASHSHTASQPSLNTGGGLAVDSATHSHGSTSPTLAAKSTSVVDNAVHAHSSTSPTVVTSGSQPAVAVNDNTHASSSTSPILLFNVSNWQAQTPASSEWTTTTPSGTWTPLDSQSSEWTPQTPSAGDWSDVEPLTGTWS